MNVLTISVCSALAVLGLWALTHPVARIRRAQFQRHKPRMSDDEFLRLACVDQSNAHIVLAIRRVLGRMCKVPPEIIYPSDDPNVVARLMYSWLLDGWDEQWFCALLEDQLGVEIEERTCDHAPEFVFQTWIGRKNAAQSVGAWAKAMAEQLR